MAEYPKSFLPVPSPIRPVGKKLREEAESPPPKDDSETATPTESFPPPQAGRYYATSLQGTGFSYLQQQLLDASDDPTNNTESEPALSRSSQELLKRLFQEHNVSIQQQEQPPSRPFKKIKPAEIKTVDATLSDETVLQLARQVPSPMSLLASILAVLEESCRAAGGNTVVSARTFLKTCALAVRPGLVPAHMDAKEMVLAGLHFLSSINASVATCLDGTSPPWITPVRPVGDLEKRSYQKVGNWTLDEIKPAVVRLEQDVFYGSTGDNLKWLPRCRFGPTVLASQVEEDLLWLKGHAPAQQKAIRKKKVTAKSPVMAAAPIKSTESSSEADPVALEATRIMSETAKTTTSGTTVPVDSSQENLSTQMSHTSHE